MFGKYGGVDAKTFTFEKESDWTWTVRPARWKDEAERDHRLFTGYDVRRIGDVEIRNIELGTSDVINLEVFLTFEESNIPDPDSPEKPFLTKDMTEPEFMKRLGTLPTEMVKEIYGFVIEMNPQWAPGYDEGN